MVSKSGFFPPSAQRSLCLARVSSAVRVSWLASKMAELKRLGMVCCVLLRGEEVDESGGWSNSCEKKCMLK